MHGAENFFQAYGDDSLIHRTWRGGPAEEEGRMIRAGLVVIVVVSVALLMMVMTGDWLDAWPFFIGRA
jgi:hypothetical protein